MPINHDDEYHTEHPWPKDVYWNEVTSFDEPINRPGIKNLDDWEVIKQDLRQEEINHPKKTVYDRAFIPGWDD